MKSTITLKKAVESLQPIVTALVKTESDARGIAHQYDFPARYEGPEKFLDKVQAAVDKRFEAIIGRKLKEGDYADPGTIRRILDQIGQLANLVGIENFVPGSRRPSATRWSDDPRNFEQPGHDDPRSTRWDTREVLAIVPQLNPDGSLRNSNSKKKR